MFQRTLAPHLASAADQFPVVYLTGPRQSGKTTLARTCFPGFRYISLENLQNRAEATQDPRGFLRQLERLPGVILDEARHTPDLFSYIQEFVDENRSGPLILTASQNFLLSATSRAAAGRAGHPGCTSRTRVCCAACSASASPAISRPTPCAVRSSRTSS